MSLRKISACIFVMSIALGAAAGAPTAQTPAPGKMGSGAFFAGYPRKRHPTPFLAQGQTAGRGAAPPQPLAADQLTCIELAGVMRTAVANDGRLRDWPQLNRYREANRGVNGVDVVFMGDSITDFWPQPQFGDFFPGASTSAAASARRPHLRC